MLHWQESLTTCVAEIDAEHRVIFGLLARLDDGCVNAALAELHEFLQHHFVHEQRLMDESAYPDREEHRRQHAHLVRRVEHLRATIPTWTAAHLEELRALLSDWLRTHIAVHDKALALWYEAWLAHAQDSGGRLLRTAA